jgi:hypothetical protein
MFLHAYVWCDKMIGGELAHSCQHGAGPHDIKVCIVKKDNKENWSAIQQAASGQRVH